MRRRSRAGLQDLKGAFAVDKPVIFPRQGRGRDHSRARTIRDRPQMRGWGPDQRAFGHAWCALALQHGGDRLACADLADRILDIEAGIVAVILRRLA